MSSTRPSAPATEISRKCRIIATQRKQEMADLGCSQKDYNDAYASCRPFLDLPERGRHHRVRLGLPGQDGGERSAAHHADPITHANDFEEVTGNQKHGDAVMCKPAYNLVDFTLRAHVHALRWFI